MVRSVERCIDQLELLAREGPLSLSQMSRSLSVPKSTLLMIARTLVARDLVAFDPDTKTYRPGPGLARLGGQSGPPVDLGALAKVHLENLVEATHETAFLAVPEGDQVVYACKVDSPQPVQYLAQLGARRPLHATAAGKVWLAHLSDAEVRACVRRTGLRRFTANTITSTAKLYRELQLIRRRGYALNLGEFFPDLFGIGAPVWGRPGRVIASLNLGGPLFRLDRRVLTLARAVGAAAAGLSADIRRVGGNVRVAS